jgi:hypothetical protein
VASTPSTKSVRLEETYVWREDDRTIVMAGDFPKVINFHPETEPRAWPILDDFLKLKGK